MTAYMSNKICNMVAVKTSTCTNMANGYNMVSQCAIIAIMAKNNNGRLGFIIPLKYTVKKPHVCIKQL